MVDRQPVLPRTTMVAGDTVVAGWARALLRRPRLVTLLDERPQLTILRAPTGYGKSVLVREWAAAAGHGSDDSRSVELLSARHLPGDRLRSVMEQASGTVVIDDHDQLAPEVDAFLLEALGRSDRLQLVLGVTDPQRLRHVGDVPGGTVEIGPPALAFTVDETATVARMMVPELASAVAQAVHERLVGWPGPVVATLIELARTADRHAIGFALDTATDRLTDQLEQLDQWGGQAVLALVLPERVTADVAAAAGVERADRALGQLAAMGLVRSCQDEPEPGFRWEPGMRLGLARRLTARHRDLARQVHRRLVAHFATRHRPADELRHAMATGQGSTVVDAIDRSWGALLNGDRAQLRSALAQIPLRQFRGHPRAQVARAVVLGLPDAEIRALVDERRTDATATSEGVETDTAMMVALRVRGMWDRARVLADRVASGAVHVQRSGHVGAPRFPVRMLQVGITRFLLGDLAGSIPALQTARREAHTGDRDYVARDAASKLSCALAMRGDLDGARRWLSDFRRQRTRSASNADWILSTALVAEVLMETAALSSHRADEAAHRLYGMTENQEYWGFRLLALVRHATSSGSPGWAQQLLSDARALFRPDRAEGLLMPVAGGFADVLLTAAEANLHLALGHGARAERLLTTVADHPALRQPRARCALLTGNPELALVWTCRGLADSRTLPGELAELFLLRATARHRTGADDMAATDIRQALHLTQRHDNLDAWRSVPRDDLLDLTALVPGLAQLLDTDRLVEAGAIYPVSVPVIDLTERETVLLQLLNEGSNLQAMSERLYVSVNTLKSQRRSLYHKLDATSRDQALIRAHDYGLLDVDDDSRGWTDSLQVHGSAGGTKG